MTMRIASHSTKRADVYEPAIRTRMRRCCWALLPGGRAGPIGDDAGVASLADIVVDCARPASLARFWAAALDNYRVALYDDEELDRLRSIGVADVEDDPTVLVEPSDGRGPRLWFQRVPSRSTARIAFTSTFGA